VFILINQSMLEEEYELEEDLSRLEIRWCCLGGDRALLFSFDLERDLERDLMILTIGSGFASSILGFSISPSIYFSCICSNIRSFSLFASLFTLFSSLRLISFSASF
jgi:hypothetical protein